MKISQLRYFKGFDIFHNHHFFKYFIDKNVMVELPTREELFQPGHVRDSLKLILLYRVSYLLVHVMATRGYCNKKLLVQKKLIIQCKLLNWFQYAVIDMDGS